jgi:hypothetical protein
MKIRRERVSAALAQACSPQRSSRVDRDSPAVGPQRQRNFQLPGTRLRDNVVGLRVRRNFRLAVTWSEWVREAFLPGIKPAIKGPRSRLPSLGLLDEFPSSAMFPRVIG